MNRIVKEAYQNVWTATHKKPARLAGMIVRPQFNNWSCGPHAIRFCLMKWHHDVELTTIVELTRSTRAGTDDLNMQLGIHLLGYKWYQFNAMSAHEAKTTIYRELKKGRPLILCVENWSHWVAVLHHSRRGFLVFDSSRPGPVIQLRGWKWLQRQLRYVPPSTCRAIYSIASISKRPVQRSK